MGWGEGRELNKESKLLGVKLKRSLKLRCSGTNFQFWLGNTSSIVLCLVAQSCSTLCEPMDSPSMGILQARILEWVAMPSSRGSSRPRNRALVSRIASRFLKSEPPGKPKNTEVGSLSLQRGQWHPTPVLLPGEPHGRGHNWATELNGTELNWSDLAAAGAEKFYNQRLESKARIRCNKGGVSKNALGKEGGGTVTRFPLKKRRQ